MRRLLPILLALVVALVAAHGAKAQEADTLIEGGVIYTLVDDQPSVVEALAIYHGEVIVAGSRADAEQHVGPWTRKIDLQGRWALPGLVDAHAHLQGLGLALSTVDLRGTTSAEECIERARKAHAELPEGAWLRGRGWDQNDWAVQEFPTRALLDEAFGDRPVYFTRIDGHAAWVSSAALELAGVGAETPDPEGGEIIRDEDGVPTGVLVDEAEGLVAQHIPEASEAELERNYRLAIEAVHELGLVGVHDMGVTLEQLRVLERADREGWLDLRLITFIGGADELARYDGGPVRPGPAAHLWVDGVKFYVDGALGSRGAALLEDYSDRPGHRGLLIQEPEVLTRQMAAAMRRDLTIAVHAIGDRANRVALDAILGAYDLLRSEGLDLPPLAALRPRIEHAQIVHPDDFDRFCQLGILPSMQPTHCTSDMPWAGARLGDRRLEGAYAWRTFRDRGCLLPLGSDFPVEKPSPWLGLYAARTRQTPDGTPVGGWSPEQRLSALEALLGFTRWTAEALGVEGWGDLGVGSRADLIVVDHDPLTENPRELLETKVLLTMVDGEIVFER